MVNSILNPKINFPELKKLDPDDKQFDASMYEVNILGEDVIIALGQAKYAFIDDNIIYYPIYLVKNDKVSTQIGVYEILAEQLPNVVDDDGDIDLTQVDEPLLYKFVNDKILFDNTSEKRKDKVSKDESDDGKDDDVVGEVVDEKEAVRKTLMRKRLIKSSLIWIYPNKRKMLWKKNFVNIKKTLDNHGYRNFLKVTNTK